MARKFLYVIAALIVLFMAGRLALGFYPEQLTRMAFTPAAAFEQQPVAAPNAYADPAKWIARPDLKESSPAQWLPTGFKAEDKQLAVPVFFIHPTTYLKRAHWNAPLDDADANRIAGMMVRAAATPFNVSSQVWAPRYRQAAFGAFLSDAPDAGEALELAHGDVLQAFDAFLAATPPQLPIVLAGHSQGAYHLRRLLAERVAGTPLAKRIAAVYLIGWPISRDHDLPRMGLPACTAPAEAGCVISWLSFGEPADPAMMLRAGARMKGLDGQPLTGGPVLCSNPLTGAQGGAAPASANLGSLVLDARFDSGTVKPGLAAAKCDASGVLLLGGEPAMGPVVMPGNNYHAYDIPLFWTNLRDDFARRVMAWQTHH